MDEIIPKPSFNTEVSLVDKIIAAPVDAIDKVILDMYVYLAANAAVWTSRVDNTISSYHANLSSSWFRN
jgi:hypothetical protein